MHWCVDFCILVFLIFSVCFKKQGKIFFNDFINWFVLNLSHINEPIILAATLMKMKIKTKKKTFYIHTINASSMYNNHFNFCLNRKKIIQLDVIR